MSASSKKKLRREQNAAMLTEKQVQEQKEAKKLQNYTRAFTIVIALILVVSIVTIAITGIGSTGIFERSTKAITIGTHELTAAELNYFYSDVIQNTYNKWSTDYGEYMSLLVQWYEGFQMNVPLDKQDHPTAGKTWADFFTDIAVEEAHDVYALYDEAIANNFTLTEEDQADLDESIEAMEFEATLLRGFANLKEYLKAMYGRGAEIETFRKHMEVMTLAQKYYDHIYETPVYEDADLREFESENPAKYSNFNFTSFQLNPSDFIECTASADDKTHVHTEEENAAALVAAEAAAKELVKSGAKNAEELDKAIKALDKYAESTTAKATLSEHTAYTRINASIAKWLSEEGRKEGDIAVVPTEYTVTADDGTETTKISSYFVVIFHSEEDNNVNMVDIRHILIQIANGTTDEEGNTVYKDEDKAAALQKINDIKAEFEGMKKNEDNFAELAKKYSTDGSKSNGGLYENVYPHQMVEAFNDWCFDPARKAGDYEVVETEYGYHLIYFVRTQDVLYRDYMIENDLRAHDAEEWYESVTQPREYTVHNTSRLNRSMIIGSN